ncbi:TolB family protein [Roseivirga pacifica]
MKKHLCFSLLILLLSCSKEQNYQLSYINNGNEVLDIYLFNTKDSSSIPLIENTNTKYNMTWNEKGDALYYTEYMKSGRSINKLNLQTKSVEQILLDTLSLTLNDVSKDEKTLLVSSARKQAKGEIYIYNISNKTWLQLTHNELYEAGAKFSHDETKVITSIQTQAGDSIYQSGIAEIFEIDLATLHTKQLSDLKHFNALPDPSPKDNSITFHHCENGNCDIYLMTSEGNNLINLTKGKDDNRWPRWSPDGQMIAFTKTIKDNAEIYFWEKVSSTIKPVIKSSKRDEVAEFRPIN